MASISKHRKTDDRISNLPTDLTARILSLLPTKDVVRTSTLSTLWNRQWTSIAHLDFDDSDFLLATKRTATSQTMFVSFVYRVLLFLNVTHLDSFRLRCDEYYDDLHINAWVSAALSRGVQQLDIAIPMAHQPFPSRSLFASRTLVVLKLGRDIDLQVPITISLESLKILCLESVEFSDGESLSRFISSCPTLEDLEMHGFIGRNVQVINITSLGLKRLTFVDVSWAQTVTEIDTRTIVLNTPNLQYFKHDDYLIPESYSIESLPYLVRAHICLGQTPQQEYLAREATTTTMTSLFVGISNVQFLCVSSKSIEVQCRLPIFTHLTYLKIYAGALLTRFLECSPRLQTLVFESDVVPYDSETGLIDNWSLPTSVPSCMLFHLKVIEVPYFEGLEEELYILRYFLGKSEVLEELRIKFSCLDKKQEAVVIKKLLDLPRASRSCKIVLTIKELRLW